MGRTFERMMVREHEDGLERLLANVKDQLEAVAA